MHDIFLDNTHVELSLWDTAGQEEFDRLRSLSYDNTHAIMLCFSVSIGPLPYTAVVGSACWARAWSGMLCEGLTWVLQVDSPDSLENIETKWKAEIEENCPGVKLVLVALKCDLRESHQEDDEAGQSSEPKRPMIQYQQGLEVAQRIKALRYLGELDEEQALHDADCGS